MMKWLSWFQRGRSDGRAGQTVLERDENSYLWSRERHRSGEVPYFLPSDSREIHRLDFQHFMVRYAIQRNYIAPLQNPKGILDVGCGTGRWAHEPNTLVVSVRDEGNGINEEEQKYIFERFYRASSREKADGLGLGLYIANRIVTQHEGRMWVESTQGKGSTFYFTLPLSQQTTKE